MSCNYDFLGDEKGDTPPELQAQVDKLERELLDKLSAGDATTRLQLQDTLATIVMNAGKHVLFYIGSPDAGKSFFVHCIDAALGDYAGIFQRGTFYSRAEKGGDDPRPELARNMKKRVATVHEAASAKQAGPNGAMTAKPFNCEVLKEHTGGDSLSYRDLRRSNQRGEPQFTLLFLANNMPNLRGADDATVKRIYIVEFKAKFVKTASQVDEKNHVYLGKTKAEAKEFYSSNRQFMMLLMIKYFKKLHERNYVLTPMHPDSLAAAELRDGDLGVFVREFMKANFNKTDGSFDTKLKDRQQLENTLYSVTTLLNEVQAAMRDDETLSARVAELTLADLRRRLADAGYDVRRPPGNSKQYYKAGACLRVKRRKLIAPD